jgi:hypothetical protein
MYLAVPQQPDCASAWREAVRAVDSQPGHSAYNVILDVADPVAANSPFQDPRTKIVDNFLSAHEKSVETIANTIFPQSLYYRYRSPEFFDIFVKNVLGKVRRNERWSGYYFERMIRLPGSDMNPLWDIVTRIRNPSVTALNKFELPIFDTHRDVDDSPYGGQCLSFLSFKLQSGSPKTLALTAVYRNHFYTEKLLGNLIGLGRLMNFVAREADLSVGNLTVVSTHAEIDLPGNRRRGDINRLLADFDQTAKQLVMT